MSGPAHPVDDLAAHAVGALTADEAGSVEAHIARCGVCRAAFADHLATLAALTGDSPPPDGLWHRIEARLDSTAGSTLAPPPVPLLPPAAAPARRADAPAPPVGWDGSARRPGAAAPPVDGGAPARWSRRRGRRGGRAWPAARLAAAAVLVVAVGATLARLAAPDGTPTVAEGAESALEDPDATVTRLDDPASGAPAARFVVTPEGDAYVMLDDLAPLPAERTYQLWRTETTTPISLGVLGPGRARAAEVHVPPGRARLVISQEPAGGSPAPTGPLVAAGTVG